MSEQFSSYDVARLNFDGSGSVVVDALAHTFTVTGGATQNASFVKYGANTLYCPAAGSVSSPNHADWDMSGGDFNIDFFIAFNSVPTNCTDQGILEIGDTINFAISLRSYYNGALKGGIKALVQIGGVTTTVN